VGAPPTPGPVGNQPPHPGFHLAMMHRANSISIFRAGNGKREVRGQNPAGGAGQGPSAETAAELQQDAVRHSGTVPVVMERPSISKGTFSDRDDFAD